MDEIEILGQEPELLTLCSRITAAYVGFNTIASDELPALVRGIYAALAASPDAETVEEQRREPAVPVKRSVFRDYIVCLEDGKKLKMLKRHLQQAYQLTPDAYRERWGLPKDYPMVAPNYAKRRSELAQSIGLGRRVNSESQDTPPPPEQEVAGIAVTKVPARRRGRKAALPSVEAEQASARPALKAQGKI